MLLVSATYVHKIFPQLILNCMLSPISSNLLLVSFPVLVLCVTYRTLVKNDFVAVRFMMVEALFGDV